MSKDIKKENTKGYTDKEEKELQEEEVNGFCSCRTQEKMHCNHDCLGDGALISSSH